ncbi:MAG: sigma-54-dependent Fis family transcriptional regulator [Thermodesulfovibrionia bacterium]|nr:sigma-54-dependent Fis family transcriptional regulator [Thermodesulfovibrionia bacterium]
MDKILVVDDQKGVLHSFKKILGKHGYDVITATSGEKALQKIALETPALVIMDVTMPKMNGLETLKRLKTLYQSLTIIMMTAYSTSEKAITAMKYGAYDFLTKPFDNTQLISLVEKAILAGKMSLPVSLNGAEDEEGDRIIGKSPSMLETYKKIGQVAESNVTVLLRGETGTGKELIARAIYHHSTRVNKPFLPVNCAAIPESLLESELFGHEKGAFTGADNRRIGKFEQCDTGTMFLDEIGDMPLSLQSKLLRVLEDGCFQRLGGRDVIKTDVRIIAATNKNLEALGNMGQFRDDLYWRLNVVSILVPPLKERKDDLEGLIQYFIQKFNRQLGKAVKGVAPEILREFMDYHWPGNVRELQSIIHRGMVLCHNDFLSAKDCEWLSQIKLPGEITTEIEQTFSDVVNELLERGQKDIYKKAVLTFEHLLVKRALELTKNNQVLAAKMLGISRNTLREKLEKNEDISLFKK